jgi:hypothetical protein
MIDKTLFYALWNRRLPSKDRKISVIFPDFSSARFSYRIGLKSQAGIIDPAG